MRLDLVSQAVSHERAAAQHEKRSSEIGLELATVTRAVEDRAREVATLARMRKVQDDTRDRIAASHDGWGDQRTAALSDAKASAESVSQALAAVKVILNDRATPSYDAVTSAYDQAVGEARKGQSALRQPAAMVSGAAQQALAEIHGGMGEALGSLADVLESLQGMPDVKVSGLDAKAIRSKAKEAKDAAKQAISSASSSYRSAGGRVSELGDLIDPAASAAAHEDDASDYDDASAEMGEDASYDDGAMVDETEDMADEMSEEDPG